MLGVGRRTFLRSIVNWMHAKHADLGSLGACPQDFCGSEIDLVGLGTYSNLTLVSKTDSAIISPYMVCYCVNYFQISGVGGGGGGSLAGGGKFRVPPPPLCMKP